MIEHLLSIVDDRHNVGIVVLIVIVEGIEENPESCPHIRAAENGAIVGAFRGCVPECQTVRSYSPSTTYTEYYLHLPPVKVNRLLRPYCT